LTLDEQESADSDAEVKGYDIFCHECHEMVDAYCWSSVEGDAEERDDEWYVHCGGCGCAIEFGWSHPERGGRIWPAECVSILILGRAGQNRVTKNTGGKKVGYDRRHRLLRR